MKHLLHKANALKKTGVMLITLVLVLVLAGTACAEVNPEFSKVFTDQHLIHITNIFFMMDSDAYVIQTDDYIECLEFGYKDDIICSYVNTIYLNVAGLSYDDIVNVDANLRSSYAFVESMENVSIAFGDIKDGAINYYKMVISADNVNDPQVVRSLSDAGLLVLDGNSGSLSMSQTDSALLAGGYIKR